MWSGFPIHRKRNLLIMSFLLFKIILWGSRKASLASFYWETEVRDYLTCPRSHSWILVVLKLQVCLLLVQSFLSTLQGNWRGKERNSREPKEIRIFHYTVTLFWLAEQEWLCLVFSQGLSASQNPCQEHPAFFSEHKERWSLVIITEHTIYENILKLKASKLILDPQLYTKNNGGCFNWDW